MHKVMEANDLRATMNATGIGYAGIDGVWWQLAAAPFALPQSAKTQLDGIGRAIFALFDVVGELYDTPTGDACGLTALLRHRVPERLWRFASRAPVLSVRPDFQLSSPAFDSSYRFVATELEMCPSAQGYAHAMQLGYGLQMDLLHATAKMLNGRELIFVSTQHWSEFIWEQLAFCKALAEIGAHGRVWLDLPIDLFCAQVQQHQRWQPPIFGVPQQPSRWDIDVYTRLETHRLTPFLMDELPTDRNDVVVFRFGYLDCFEPALLGQLQTWEQRGASFLNPTSYLWDSKVVMAALQLPAIREHLAAYLPTLDQCIPATHLLTPDTFRHVCDTRQEWVLKFAGFDSGQQAWGGRSLQVGAHHSDASWRAMLQRYVDLPFPVVAQRVAPTETVSIDYFDGDNTRQTMHNGRTRLRSFLVRDIGAMGSHLTVSASEGGVSEGIAAVQAPIQFSS